MRACPKQSVALGIVELFVFLDTHHEPAMKLFNAFLLPRMVFRIRLKVLKFVLGGLG